METIQPFLIALIEAGKTISSIQLDGDRSSDRIGPQLSPGMMRCKDCYREIAPTYRTTTQGANLPLPLLIIYLVAF